MAGLRRSKHLLADPLVLYWAAAGAVAALACVYLLFHTRGLSEPIAVAGLALAAAIAERGRVRLATHTEASISLLPTTLAAVAFGPLPAMIVAGASFLGELRRSAPRPLVRWGIYTSTRMISGGAAGLVASLATGSGPPASISDFALAATAAAVTAEALDIGFGCLTLTLRGGHAREWIRMYSPIALATVSLYIPVVALLALAYRQVSPWTLPLFFVPALAAQRVFALYQTQRDLTDSLVTANSRLEAANLSFASALVATLDARDRYTAGHSAAVAIYARDIAHRLGLSDEQQQLVHLCGLVHDIGKIGLPAGLLEKPGALTLEERRVMETHPEIGERILSKVDTYTEIASIVRHHHERIDGQGYPDGLADESIPLLSRIIAVADAYNAMTSDRPYRDAMPSRVARVRLAQAVDSQFDTGVVAAFEAVLVGATEEYRCGLGPEFRWVDPEDAGILDLEVAYSSA
jgi:putative nucleotidyltransferase with HDIG domain